MGHLTSSTMSGWFLSNGGAISAFLCIEAIVLSVPRVSSKSKRQTAMTESSQMVVHVCSFAHGLRVNCGNKIIMQVTKGHRWLASHLHSSTYCVCAIIMVLWAGR